jgi:hypothetical protein
MQPPADARDSLWDGSRRNQNVRTPARYGSVLKPRAGKIVKKGETGDGLGARALSTPPANLRLLSERYGNPLPADQIARYIDGRADVKAHGPRDMPVWGEEAWKYDGKGSKGRARGWVSKVVAYLQSIQKPVQQASLLKREQY